MIDRSVLENIRILDFSWVLAGPYATRLLADFGAEVIKVQPLISTEMDDAFARGYYNTWNRNKLGITLNMNRPEGVELAKRLIAVSDAVVENFTPRVMGNWGLDYDNLVKIKPDIIMLSMSAMGHTGSLRDYAGFGPAVHAFSGMTRLTSFPARPPSGPGFSYADHVAALYTSLALLGALEHRNGTGEGQYIDVSQVEAMTSLLGSAFVDPGAADGGPSPDGNDSPGAAPYGVYPCRGEDRWCAVAVFSDEEWEGFKHALGSPSWVEDKKFATMPVRLENREDLDRHVAAWTTERTAEEAVSVMQENGVTAGVVRNAADLARDPALKARGFFVELEQTVSDASPIRLSRIPAQYRRAAPVPGQDNGYVYGKLLGLSEREISRLRDSGVI